jgi:adenylylsulfate kinase-like enzyme
VVVWITGLAGSGKTTLGRHLYAPAMRHEITNVVGVDQPFTPPAAPDMMIDNSRDGADLRSFAAGILDKALAP